MLRLYREFVIVQIIRILCKNEQINVSTSPIDMEAIVVYEEGMKNLVIKNRKEKRGCPIP